MACCVLHNWCLIEDVDDESAFGTFGDELETEVNLDETGPVQRASSGGVTKRDILCEIIRNLQ